MSMYQFLPSPDFHGNEGSYGRWDNGFTPEELDKIIAYGDALLEQQGHLATVGTGGVSPEIRRSKVTWFQNNSETGWIYDKLAYIARMANAQFFDFDLYGFSEDFQYTTYHGLDQGHYDWHIDRGVGNNGSCPRKLSMVLLLSDPADYEGGDLQVQYGDGPTSVDRTRGTVHIFPSWVLHRVNPVLKGVRKTLVVWATGPKFR